MPSDQSLNKTATAGDSGQSIGDPNVFTVNVPEDLIWYVDKAIWDEIGAPSEVAVAITSEPDTLSSLSDASVYESSTDSSGTLSVGQYAYAGDTIAVAVDAPTSDQPILVGIREM